MTTKSIIRVLSFIIFIVGACIGVIVPAPLQADEASGESLTFEKDVRPIFKAMCFQCHGEQPELKGRLDLRLVRLMLKGGESGAGLVAGNASASKLWQRIEADEMPDGSKKLSPDQKAIIRRWIEQGAKTSRPEPEDVHQAKYTSEELAYWAFQKPVRPALPATDLPVDNPIDAFIADAHRQNGLSFSAEADRATLLRRLKLDLLGLPPTPEEIADFESDESANAYESLVDRMLDSPQHGVRWARHWLDVTGYSESDGNRGKDHERDYAWRYRDYWIRSLNADKPYDQLVLEQIAGDEMIDGPLDTESERHVELLTATGLLRMAPDVTASENTILERNQAVADTIKVVSSSILGLSIGCAQCHDHRYDPISIEDYYQFRAIFDPAFPLQAWRQPDQRLVDMTCATDRAKREELEIEAVRREADLNQRKREVGKKIFDLKIAEVPEEIRPSVLAAVDTPANTRNPEQVKLLLEYPMVKTIDEIVGQLVEFDKVFNMENYKKFEAERKEIAKFRESKPPQRMIMAVSDDVSKIPESAVMMRGDPEQRSQSVRPSEIFVLARDRSLDAIPLEPVGNLKSTGRRFAYARQLIDRSHPLVARVAVNRLWQHHFGRGLVGTPNDFGFFGQRPTHPELLDYLAVDFMDGGWRFKRLHKLMVMSRTYRQQSVRQPVFDAVDADNRYYSRMNLTRLDAEQIRDCMLFASGKLSLEIGGPSVPVSENEEGRATIGIRRLNEGLFGGIEDVGPRKYRRSIFLQTKRTLFLNLLETFDLPQMNPNCDARKCSTVAPQALLFLNDEEVIQHAQDVAERVWGASDNNPDRFRDLFFRVLIRCPTIDEVSQCETFFIRQRQIFADDSNPDWKKQVENSPQAPDVRAMASLCQVLMASNRFLYVD